MKLLILSSIELASHISVVSMKIILPIKGVIRTTVKDMKLMFAAEGRITSSIYPLNMSSTLSLKIIQATSIFNNLSRNKTDINPDNSPKKIIVGLFNSLPGYKRVINNLTY